MTSSKDIEAQKIAAGAHTANSEFLTSGYAHHGRGGAGNFTSARKLSEAAAETADVTLSLQETKPPETGYYGRGGAGNYRGEDTEKKEEYMRRAAEVQEKVYRQVVRDVEIGLKEPEKAHLGSGRIENIQ